MTTELRNTEAGRALYNQLRLQLSFPGDVVAEIRRPFQPVNRDNLTWDEAMLLPSEPNARALTGKLFWFMLGKHGVGAV